jgi:phosphoglycolate phosphatase
MALAPTVVFDLDGTLVETAPDLVDTLNLIFARQGLPPVGYELARKLVGGGARALIEGGLAAEGRRLAPSEVGRLVSEFIAHYGAHIADRSRPFPGLMAALDTLATNGCRLAVCTNKLEWLSVRLLGTLGLLPWFAAVCGADTFGLQKPNPEFLRQTIGRAGGRLGQAVMVGDSNTDVAMARAAGVPVIAVDYGYSETPVAQLGPARVVSRLSDLPSAVFDLLGMAHRAATEPG